MLIRYLHIKNFRSLRDVELNGLGSLNIIIGKNSSGKSNLLEALGVFYGDFSIIGGNTAGLNEYYWFDRKTIGNPIEFEVHFEMSKNEIEDILTPQIVEELKKLGARTPELIVKRRIMNTQ